MDRQDQKTFERELVALIPHLRAFARSLCGDATAADDLAQEAVAKAWASRTSFQLGTNMKAWTFMILRNQFYSEKRRSWRSVGLDPETAERSLVANTNFDGAVELDDLRQAMMMLPENQREEPGHQRRAPGVVGDLLGDRRGGLGERHIRLRVALGRTPRRASLADHALDLGDLGLGHRRALWRQAPDALSVALQRLDRTKIAPRPGHAVANLGLPRRAVRNRPDVLGQSHVARHVVGHLLIGHRAAMRLQALDDRSHESVEGRDVGEGGHSASAFSLCSRALAGRARIASTMSTVARLTATTRPSRSMTWSL